MGNLRVITKENNPPVCNKRQPCADTSSSKKGASRGEARTVDPYVLEVRVHLERLVAGTSLQRQEAGELTEVINDLAMHTYTKSCARNRPARAKGQTCHVCGACEGIRYPSGGESMEHGWGVVFSIDLGAVRAAKLVIFGICRCSGRVVPQNTNGMLPSSWRIAIRT